VAGRARLGENARGTIGTSRMFGPLWTSRAQRRRSRGRDQSALRGRQRRQRLHVTNSF
jgi:hypothetical protein